MTDNLSEAMDSLSKSIHESLMKGHDEWVAKYNTIEPTLRQALHNQAAIFLLSDNKLSLLDRIEPVITAAADLFVHITWVNTQDNQKRFMKQIAHAAQQRLARLDIYLDTYKSKNGIFSYQPVTWAVSNRTVKLKKNPPPIEIMVLHALQIAADAPVICDYLIELVNYGTALHKMTINLT